MKTLRNWLILTPLLAFGILSAQETPVPAPSKPIENVTLHIQGTVMGSPVDMTCIEGTNLNLGPNGGFHVNVYPNGGGGSIFSMKIDGGVKSTDAGYQAQITVFGEVQLKASATGGQTNHMIAVQHQIMALLKPGQPVAIADSAECSLTVTLGKFGDTAKPAGPETALLVQDQNGRLGENFKILVKMTKPNSPPLNLSAVVAGQKTSMQILREMVALPGRQDPMPVFGSLDVVLQAEPGGEWGVRFAYNDQTPFQTTSPNGIPAISFYVKSANFDVVVEKLDEPITLYKNGDETITLTFTRADQP